MRSEGCCDLLALLPCPVVHFEWTIEVLVGYHLMEPFLGVMMDQQHNFLKNLYKQMMEPLSRLWFHLIEKHALHALVDGFIRKYGWNHFVMTFSNMIQQSWKTQCEQS